MSESPSLKDRADQLWKEIERNDKKVEQNATFARILGAVYGSSLLWVIVGGPGANESQLRQRVEAGLQAAGRFIGHEPAASDDVLKSLLFSLAGALYILAGIHLVGAAFPDPLPHALPDELGDSYLRDLRQRSETIKNSCGEHYDELWGTARFSLYALLVVGLALSLEQPLLPGIREVAEMLAEAVLGAAAFCYVQWRVGQMPIAVRVAVLAIPVLFVLTLFGRRWLPVDVDIEVLAVMAYLEVLFFVMALAMLPVVPWRRLANVFAWVRTATGRIV